MLTSFRGLMAVSLASVSLISAAPVRAQVSNPAEEVEDGVDAGPVTVSANVALTTDYRFRGVSYSGGDFASRAVSTSRTPAASM